MSDAVFNHTPTIVLDIRRCWQCGAFWALEKSKGDGTCPCCARRAADSAEAERITLIRRLNSQKAATSRLSRQNPRGNGRKVER